MGWLLSLQGMLENLPKIQKTRKREVNLCLVIVELSFMFGPYIYDLTKD